MSGVADRFAEKAPGVESATGVQHGEYIHEYRGTVTTVDERVRLFVLAPRIDDEAVHDAFRRTARQWHSPSTHPNIVTVHSRDTTPRPWIATADPDGTPLAPDASLSVPAVRDTIEDVAEAVRNAHLYSTTHLDLTPGDIWVNNTEDGRTTLVDNWGLERACRVAAGERPLSPFTAPELVADPAGGTEQTDVYGLGAVAYYALTEQAPVSDTERLESAIEAGPETPPSAVDSTLPGQIDNVVMTALSSDPAVRHESAYDFRTAVTTALPDRSDRSVDSDARRDTDAQTRDHQSGTDTGQAGETGASSGTATQAETTLSNDDRSRVTRRRVVLAIGGIALSSIGWLRFRSGSDREPGPGVASTATPTPTPAPTPTPTAAVTETTAEPDSPTPTESAESDSTETPTATPVSTDGVSMFRYGPANTGTRADATGPTSYMVEQWTFRVGREVISSPTVVGETVYVGANNGTVYALDAADGTEKWQSETGNRVRSSPAVTEETVYVGSDDGRVYALDASEGFEKWSHQTGGAVFSSPAVVNGSVYVGSNDRQIYALDAADGTEEWSFETNDRVRSSPAVVDGTTYVGSDDGNLYALDAADGTRDWRFETTATVYSSPSVVDETVYVGTHNTSLYAVGSEYGIEQWSFQGSGRIFSSPAVANGTACVGSGNRVYGVNASDGSEEWSFSVNGTVRSSPAIADGTVYVGSNKSALAAGGNTVYGIDAQDGTRETAFETFGDVQSSPAVANNTLYVGSGDGNVYGLTEN